MSFDSLLVANRGEIALRILRTARAVGLRTVAVYTDADAHAPFVAFADTAVRIGAGPAADSYLNADAILSAAERTGAGAIHPGYGFLSENAGFAQAVAQAGLVFVGPAADSIALMGDKAAARVRMSAAGVPCLPGYDGEAQDADTLVKEAARIGWPVMLKAAAGGGGRGMRFVAGPDAFASALGLARAEAEAAFGNGTMILERALVRPRHIEVQVIADAHGNAVHLGERDCSIQRRHQKVVEEAPAPELPDDLRRALCAAAVQVATEIGYVGAGTVEFLVEDGAFWFLEMNTRLQVEHPVTEMVTGRDLVALQLTVAQGEALGFEQADVTFTGHAIEVRLCAEDAANGFLPATGRMLRWQAGQGEGLRVDAGIAQGQEVSPHYDSLLAKVIAHGATREDARTRLQSGLARTVALGVATNRDFLCDVLADPAFAQTPTTGFLSETWAAGWQPPAPTFEDAALAAAGFWQMERDAARRASAGVADEQLGWSGMGPVAWPLVLTCGAVRWSLQVAALGNVLSVSAGEDRIEIALGDPVRIAGRKTGLVAHVVTAEAAYLCFGDRTVTFTRPGPGAPAGTQTDDAVRAPMHGVLRAIDVAEGDRVAPGDRLAVLEAMKMQHALVAGAAGRVLRIAAAVGDQVAAGALLLELEPEEDNAAG